jgi:hypothetical protein
MTGSKIKRCQNLGKLIIHGQVLKADYIPLHGYTAVCVLHEAGGEFGEGRTQVKV